jgi:hypothetical protein
MPSGGFLPVATGRQQDSKPNSLSGRVGSKFASASDLSATQPWHGEIAHPLTVNIVCLSCFDQAVEGALDQDVAQVEGAEDAGITSGNPAAAKLRTT